MSARESHQIGFAPLALLKLAEVISYPGVGVGQGEGEPVGVPAAGEGDRTVSALISTFGGPSASTMDIRKIPHFSRPAP